MILLRGRLTENLSGFVYICRALTKPKVEDGIVL